MAKTKSWVCDRRKLSQDFESLYQALRINTLITRAPARQLPALKCELTALNRQSV